MVAYLLYTVMDNQLVKLFESSSLGIDPRPCSGTFCIYFRLVIIAYCILLSIRCAQPSRYQPESVGSCGVVLGQMLGGWTLPRAGGEDMRVHHFIYGYTFYLA